MPQKSLAINTSFDPSEWQMKPFMGEGNRQKCTSRLKHLKQNTSLYIEQGKTCMAHSFCRPYVFLSQTVLLSTFSITASIE